MSTSIECNENYFRRSKYIYIFDHNCLSNIYNMLQYYPKRGIHLIGDLFLNPLVIIGLKRSSNLQYLVNSIVNQFYNDVEKLDYWVGLTHELTNRPKFLYIYQT